MIDRWATLGMPMLVQLCVPGGTGIDNHSIAPQDVLEISGSTTDLASEQLRIAGPHDSNVAGQTYRARNCLGWLV